MAKLKGLKCRECKKEYPAEPLHVCEFCFGPLEVNYNYDEIRGMISRDTMLVYVSLRRINPEAEKYRKS